MVQCADQLRILYGRLPIDYFIAVESFAVLVESGADGASEIDLALRRVAPSLLERIAKRRELLAARRQP